MSCEVKSCVFVRNKSIINMFLTSNCCFWPRNKLIYILDGMRVSTILANFHFGMNYFLRLLSFDCKCFIVNMCSVYYYKLKNTLKFYKKNCTEHFFKYNKFFQHVGFFHSSEPQRFNLWQIVWHEFLSLKFYIPHLCIFPLKRAQHASPERFAFLWWMACVSAKRCSSVHTSLGRSTLGRSVSWWTVYEYACAVRMPQQLRINNICQALKIADIPLDVLHREVRWIHVQWEIREEQWATCCFDGGIGFSLTMNLFAW